MASLTFSLISGIPLLFLIVFGIILIPSECVGSYRSWEFLPFSYYHKKLYFGPHISSRHILKVSKSSPKLSKIAEGSLILMRRSSWPLKGSNWPETWTCWDFQFFPSKYQKSIIEVAYVDLDSLDEVFYSPSNSRFLSSWWGRFNFFFSNLNFSKVLISK